MRPRIALLLFLLGTLGGIVFCAISAGDFAQHLDRQVHSIHCSILPGGAADITGSSGCHVALMSPYASFFDGWVWGGIPVALPGLALFVFLAYRGVGMWLTGTQHNRAAIALLIVMSGIAALTSVVMGGIALFALETLCKTCIGIYLSSFLCLGAALALLVGAGRDRYEDLAEIDEDDAVTMPFAAPHPVLHILVGFAESAVFVALPLLVYVLFAPDHGRFAGACGTLDKPDDPYGVHVPIGQQTAGVDAIEVFDPLCPACAGFERRLVSSGLAARLKRKAVMFPLDNACNWMISSALHPGACTVSEAVLCAGDQADAVVHWAFENQEAVRAASADDPGAAKKMVVAAFPGLARCVGSADVRARLNRSLRWTVRNKLQVLTPQLYVNGVKLCDEDTDLGLNFALPRLLNRETL